MQANNYWSSSTNASNTNNAWNVNFNNGNVNANNKTNNNYVCPVRLESDSMQLTPIPSDGIFSLKNLYTQYLKCRRNKRNTLNALEFEFNAEWKLGELALELQHKTYKAQPTIGFVVASP